MKDGNDEFLLVCRFCYKKEFCEWWAKISVDEWSEGEVEREGGRNRDIFLR